MNNIFVLDACTLINLLRIDENDFLAKKLLASRLFISEFVVNETRKNYNKNPLSSAKLKDIQTILPNFYARQELDKTIEKAEGGHLLDTIRSFVNYGKRKNGELYSTALCYLKSREEKEKIVFYTDDFPAREDFNPYYTFNQVGFINDTVDLLLLFYTLSTPANFTKNDLVRYLSSLSAEIFQDKRQFEKEMGKFLRGYKVNKKSQLQEKAQIQQLFDAFKRDPALEVDGLIRIFENKHFPNASKIEETLSKWKKQSALIDKIKFVQSKLTSFDIARIA